MTAGTKHLINGGQPLGTCTCCKEYRKQPRPVRRDGRCNACAQREAQERRKQQQGGQGRPLIEVL